MTESNDIAGVPAALSTGRGFEPGIIAVALDKVRCVSKRDTAVDEGTVHGSALTRSSVDRLRTIIVNTALTMLDLAYRQSLGMGIRMNRSSHAGGCFLSICILAGFPLGLAIGNPMKGILIGTGTGIALALLTWLIDMRRRG